MQILTSDILMYLVFYTYNIMRKHLVTHSKLSYFWKKSY
jgi:hypothetical protein